MFSSSSSSLPSKCTRSERSCLQDPLPSCTWATSSRKVSCLCMTPVKSDSTAVTIIVLRNLASLSFCLQLVEKYGPVFTVWMGPKPVVILCGYEVVKDALLGHAEEFGGRPDIPIKIPGVTGQGFEVTNDKKRTAIRRFTLSTLRDFGMGKRRMSERVQEEALFLVEEIAATQGPPPYSEGRENGRRGVRSYSLCLALLAGQPFDAKGTIRSAVSNVFCSVIFGCRFDYRDKNILEQLQFTTDFIAFFRSFFGVAYVAIPKIMGLLLGKHKKIAAHGQRVHAFICEHVNAHMQSLDPENPRDYIDCFLIKLGKDQSNNDTMFNHEDIIMTVLGLFIAGIGTTSQALHYCLLAMAKFPDIQVKVQLEIAEVIGTHRQPSTDDRVKMPFTNAVVHEIQRYQKTNFEIFSHILTCDTEFRGYKLSEGTPAIPLLYYLHFDPLQWETPQELNPDHFLDETGKFRKRDAFMPFSAGKRACPGEALAQVKLFLLLTTLLQHFTFQLSGEGKEKDLLTLSVDLNTNSVSPKLQAMRRSI
ncbi:hypothetical protein lerEdw1_017902 [Lerista edwardsae]|nr:hypothetical protein lerEdw1_017902 [Lerista edwardsae]